MIHSQSLARIRFVALVIVVGILVVSCGSYQQASYYDNDGIYDDGNVRIVEKTPHRTIQKKKDNQYADYFGQKADEYGEILDSEIFTDIDGYSSEVQNDSIANEDDLTSYYNPNNDYAGYGGWGDNATDVNINIYDNGWGWNNWGVEQPMVMEQLGMGLEQLGMGLEQSLEMEPMELGWILWLWLWLGWILRPLVLPLLRIRLWLLRK